MNVSLSPVKWQYAFAHPDKFFIFPRFRSEHIAQVRQMLNVLKDKEVPLEFEKCSFSTHITTYFGHGIRPRRLESAFYTQPMQWKNWELQQTLQSYARSSASVTSFDG